MTKQRIIHGSLIEINLGESLYAYGQVVSKSEVAFFDCIGAQKLDEEIKSIVENPILFTVAVMNSAIKSGRWRIVGKLPLLNGVTGGHSYYIENAGNYSIYSNLDGSITPCTKEATLGLECATAWSAVSVEKRLLECKQSGGPR